MNSHDVSLHVLDARQLPVDAGALNSAEMGEFTKLLDPRERTRRIAFRLAARKILAAAAGLHPTEVQWTQNKFGKPFLHGGPFFNLSHAGDTAVLAICREVDVGVDLEPRTRGREITDCLATIAHPLEAAELKRPTNDTGLPDTLIRLWVAKETVLKALGTGLSIEPSSFAIRWTDPFHGVVDWSGARDAAKDIIHIKRVGFDHLPDWEIAVALLGARPRVHLHEPLKEAAITS